MLSSKEQETRVRRVDLDARRVKSIATLTHRYVKGLPTSHYWIIFATPLMNRPYDLREVLELLCKDGFLTQDHLTAIYVYPVACNP